MIVYHLCFKKTNVSSRKRLTGPYVRVYYNHDQNKGSKTNRRHVDMFEKITKTDAFYLVAFIIMLGFLYFAMITS
ncbi:hypothetical protein GCM10027286_32590 [Virgibacillus ainsalahensis]